MGKFIKVSVPLEAEEYQRMHEAAEKIGANHAGYIRVAVQERIDRDLRAKDAPPMIAPADLQRKPRRLSW